MSLERTCNSGFAEFIGKSLKTGKRNLVAILAANIGLLVNGCVDDRVRSIEDAKIEIKICDNDKNCSSDESCVSGLCLPECGNLPGKNTTFKVPCGTSIGECNTGEREIKCVREKNKYVISETCVGEIGPSDEVCDKKDNDCDGDTDEVVDIPQIKIGSDVGECKQEILACVDGEMKVIQEPIGSTDEICNGQDDDCDGRTDEVEDVPPIKSGSNVGECTPEILECVNGEMVQTQALIESTDEICNGKDDDCDGQTDEVGDVPPILTGSSIGECKQKILECVNGEIVQTQNPVHRTDESCNGKDDDCDGQTDEVGDVPPVQSGINIGECKSEILECLNGQVIETQHPVGVTNEKCNGKDDDCNGVTDDFEGTPSDCVSAANEIAMCASAQCVYQCRENFSREIGVCCPELLNGNWSSVSTLNAPAPRYSHRAVWTGSEMIIWSGSVGGGPAQSNGGAYNSATDTWRAISSPHFQLAGSYQAAEYTGSHMIVWGGLTTPGVGTIGTNRGGMYNVALDEWREMSMTNAPSTSSFKYNYVI